MGDIEAPDSTRSRHAFFSLLPSKEFITSRKGTLLIGEVVLSFVDFVCFVASSAAAFVTAPLIEFLAALFLLFAYSTKINERFKGFHWPLMDFLRCVSASIIFFIISIISVSKYPDPASKAAGVGLPQCICKPIFDGCRSRLSLFGFIATIFFALDFYLIFNDLANFLKGGGGGESTDDPPTPPDDSDSDSD